MPLVQGAGSTLRPVCVRSAANRHQRDPIWARVSYASGDFTTTGHFIVLTGIDDKGRLVIRDPNSSERTAKTWGFDTVLEQCRALWFYTAA